MPEDESVPPSGASSRIRRKVRPRLAKFTVGGLVLAVVATGGGMLAAAASSSPTSTPLSATAENPQAQKEPVVTETYSYDQWRIVYQNRLNLANCMHQKGFTTWPDPTPTFGTGKVSALNVGGSTEPKVEAAGTTTVLADEGACLANAPTATASAAPTVTANT